MHGYPQFSFWILIALGKIYFSHTVITARKNIIVSGGKFLKKSEYPEMGRTYAQLTRISMLKKLLWCYKRILSFGKNSCKDKQTQTQQK